MTMSFGPNLGLLVDGAPGEQHMVNLMKQFRGLDGLVQGHVKDKDLATPPASPADGDMYIVATSPTGAWVGHAGKLARYYVIPANGSNGASGTSGWEFFMPRKGWRVHVEDEDVDYQYNGTGWIIAASGGGGGADNSTETVAISSGTLNLSATTKEVIVVDLNQNVTSVTMPAGVSGQAVNRRIVFTQSGAANFTVAGWGSVTIEGGTAPVAATGTGAVTEYMLSNTNNSGWRMYVDQGITLAQVGQIGGFRNKLINALGQVNQRNYVSGTATTAANQYTLDRWRVVVSGQSLVFAASGNGYQMTAPAGGVEQVVEGINIEGGTYVLNWTGTATATVNGTARAKGEAFTLPANTNATVRFTNGTVFQPQLEFSSVPTPYEHAPYGIELLRCQRYYFRTPIGGSAVVNPNGFSRHLPFPVRMRAQPTGNTNVTNANHAAISPGAGQWSLEVIGAAVCTKTGTETIQVASSSTDTGLIYGYGATYSSAGNSLSQPDNSLWAEFAAEL